MTGEIVHCEGGVVLIGGGALAAADVHEALTIAPCLVAADGGGDRALALGLQPRAVIGDLDSLSDAARAALGARVHHVAEQDSTDFAKCLDRVAARFVIGLGFTGLRLDHTLAALNELAARPGRAIVLIAEDEAIFLCPPEITLDLPAGERLSLFPMGAAAGRAEGLRWPIEGLDFTPAGRVGTSNEVAAGPVRLAISGPMLVLVPKRHLRAVLCALVP